MQGKALFKVVGLDDVHAELQTKSYSGVVSAGVDSNVGDVPRIKIFKLDSCATADEAAELFKFTTEIWNAGDKVLFHCKLGESRSPAAAMAALAEYYGPARKENVVHDVYNATKNRCDEDKDALKSFIPFFSDDAVAEHIALHAHTGFACDYQSAFLDVEQRRWIRESRQNEFYRIVRGAFRQGWSRSIPFPDDMLSPDELGIRRETMERMGVAIEIWKNVQPS